MSLQSLLTDFPNYSARKVRRLAKQLSLLEQIKLPVGEGSGITKGIADDLMEFNLQSARLEEQLGDVKAAELPPVVEETVTERISVTPHDAAYKALNTLIEYVRVNSDINVKGADFEHVIAKCRGYINGQTFTTDRVRIEARLSPQDDLPLKHADTIGGTIADAASGGAA